MATTTEIQYTAAVAMTISSWTTTLLQDQIASSAIVDNQTNKYVDVLVGGLIEQGTTTPGAGDSYDMYAYGIYDEATSSALTGGIDGLFTGADEEEIDGTDLVLANMPLITSVSAIANVGYHWGPIALAQFFGGVLPPKWGIVVHNNSATADLAAGSALEYIGVKYTSV
jgi:hypothetical protein